MKIRATETIRSSLSASDLFDLLADTRGCLTWHGHPDQARPTSIDAPPGPAVAGMTVKAYGHVGTIPCVSATSVDVAEKPRRFVTTSVSVFEHPRAPKMSSVDRIAIDDDPQGAGCIVHYDTEMSRELETLEWFGRTYLGVLHRLFSARGLKRCFRDLIAAAEKEAHRAAGVRA